MVPLLNAKRTGNGMAAGTWRPSAMHRAGLRVASVTIGSGLQRGLGGLLSIAILAAANRGQDLAAAGVAGVALVLVSIAFAVADMGTSQAVIRDFSATPPTFREFWRVARLKVGLGVVATVILTLVSALFWTREGTLALAAASLAIPALAMTSTATGKLVVEGEGVRLGFAAVLGFAAGCVPIAAWLASGGSLAALVLAFPVARLTESVALTIGCSFARRAHAPRAPRFDLLWLRSCLPLGAMSVLQTAYSRSAILAPALLLSTSGKGEIAQGFNLYLTGTLLPGALAIATWPLVGRAVRRSRAEGLRLTGVYSVLGVLSVLPASAVLLVIPGTVLEAIYGHTSPGLEAYMRWAALALFFQCPSALVLNMLISLNRGRTVAAVWALAFTLSTVLFLAGAEIWGVAGAGFGLFVAEAALLGIFICALEPPPRRVLALGGGLAAAAGVGCAAPFVSQSLAFPDPRSGLLVLLGLPFVVFFVLRALRYDLLAPAAIFTLAWTSALGVSQLPLYPSFSWSSEMWVLVTIPPAAFALACAIGTGGAARNVRHAAAGEALRFRPPRLMLVLFVLVGLVGWARFFQSIGTIPLLSGNIDSLRFAHFPFTALVATRFGQVAVIAGIFFALCVKERRLQYFYLAAAGVASAPILLSGGRLYIISAFASGAIGYILLLGISRRALLLSAAGGAAVLLVASSLFFTRIEQQTANPFKTYLDQTLKRNRPASLGFTIPLQMAASASMYTLSDLLNTRAYEREQGDGFFSTRAFDRFFPAKDIEKPAQREARFSQITSTYLAPLYADGGLELTIIASVFGGLAYGLLYRQVRKKMTLFWILFYAYAAFWLIFTIYTNYWATRGLWIVDIPIMGIIGLAGGRVAAARRRPSPLLTMGAPTTTFARTPHA